MTLVTIRGLNTPRTTSSMTHPHDGRRRIALAVLQIRLAQGLSQRELAERAGLSRSRIKRIERLQDPLRLSTLAAVAKGLGVDPVVLVQPRALH